MEVNFMLLSMYQGRLFIEDEDKIRKTMILIVEDEPDLLNLVKRYFKKEGYVCEEAITYKEGYKKINNFDYDCAIIDLNLPGGDGLKLVEILRKENSKTSISLVFSEPCCGSIVEPSDE